MSALVIPILVKSSLIMAVTALAALVSRRGSAARRHMIWAVSIAALLALPVLSLTLPSLNIPVAASAPVTRIAAVIDKIDAPFVPDAPAKRAIERSSQASPATQETIAQPQQPLPWPTIFLLTYLVGVLGFALKLVAERIAVGRLARRASEVKDPEWVALAAACRRETGAAGSVRFLRSLDQTMPMAFGVLKPTVMIPSVADTWTTDRRRAVLLHELAHIARRDCLTQLITRIACALYWPHPGAWLIARRLRMERELACDDRVLAIGTAAPDYAQHLLELAYSLGGYRAPALVVSMARPKQLEGRMLAVLDHARNRTTPATRSRLAAFAIAGLIVMPLAAAELGRVPDTSLFVAEKGAVVPDEPALSPTSTPAPAQSRSRETQRRREVQLPGTWSLRATDDPKVLQLNLVERRNSSSGFDIRIDQLQGLSSLNGNGPVKFSIRRDAGTINFEGTIRSGVAAGTFDFTPSPTFAGELAKRGYERPSNDELYVLARADIGTSYLDELSSQKYARPSLDELVRAGDHGVSLDYLYDMGRAGYHLGEIEGLIRTRDHGVDMTFIAGLKMHGLTGLSVEELVKARDHGVDPDYIGGMKHAGFDLHGLDDLIRTRDHGVDPDYIAEMKNAGYDLRNIDGLINARDHGVAHEYIADMRHHGFRLDLPELINARDHGVDDEFVAAFVEAGYKNLTIQELIRLRDHGVSASWAKRQNDRGSRLSVDELIRRRDRGGDR